VKCPECLVAEPLDTFLKVKLESGFSRNLVHVDIYEGNLEDSILYDTYILNGDIINASVTLNKDYTVTATYTSDDGTTYVAVDAVTPRVKYDTDQCDDPCYFVYDKTVDLRLKYTK
jgi:hypothetical protein